MRYCPHYSMVLRESFGELFLGEWACKCGGAGAPCPNCNKTDLNDPDDVPAMPARFKPDLS